MKGKLLIISLALLQLLAITMASEENPQVENNIKFEELKPLDIKNLTEITYPEFDIEFDEDFKPEWNLYSGLELKTKVAACGILIKNSLSKGNTEVTLALKETKHPKDKTFDKIFSMMLENCVDNIEERTIKEVVNPDNVQVWEQKYARLLAFNKKIFQIIGPDVKYSAKEKMLLDLIHDTSKNLDLIDKEENEKIEKKQFGFFGKYKHYIIGAGLGLSSFLVLVISKKFIKN